MVRQSFQVDIAGDGLLDRKRKMLGGKGGGCRRDLGDWGPAIVRMTCSSCVWPPWLLCRVTVGQVIVTWFVQGVLWGVGVKDDTGYPGC